MDRTAEVERLLAGYLEAAEAGRAPPVAEWIDAHPEYRAELAEYFALRGAIDAVAAPFRGGVDAAAAADASRFPAPFGRYTLLGELGAGGMGVVYRAALGHLQRVVALKMIRAGRFARADDRVRFRTEVEAASRLSHPLIVPVYDVGEVDEQPYYTMPVLAGGDLPARKTRYTAAPVESARLVRDLALAVHHAHQHGILHRDLKPSNILFDGEGRPHVSDFGLAKVVAGSADLTHTREVVGSPAYLSPEQADGRPATAASDVYGLGCLLYFALTGRPPFEAPTPVAVLDRVRNQLPAAIRPANPLIPRDLEAVCLKCLAKEPGDRYPSAAALAEDLDRFLDGRPVRARPIPRVVRAYRWVRRHPAEVVTAVLAVGVVAAAVGVAIGNWLQRVEERAERQAELLAAEARRIEAERKAADEAEKALAAIRSATLTEVLVQLRDRRSVPADRWAETNLERIRPVARWATTPEQAALLRTEAVAALGSVDLGTPRVLAEGLRGYAVAFTHGWDRRLLAVGSWFPTEGNRCEVRILDVPTGGEVRRLYFETDPDWERRYGSTGTDGCRALRFSFLGNSRDDRWLVAGTRSGWLIAWDLARPDAPPVRWRHAPPTDAGKDEARSETVKTLGFDGGEFLWSGCARAVVRWNPREGWGEVERLGAEGRVLARPTAVAYTGGPTPLVLAGPGTSDPTDPAVAAVALDEQLGAWWDEGANTQIGLYDRANGLRVGRLTAPDSEAAHDDGISDLEFMQDGSLLASAADNIQSLKLWDVAAGRQIAARTLPKDSAVRVAFYWDNTLAVTTVDRTLLYPLRRSEAADVVGLQPGVIADAAMSTCGRFLVTATTGSGGATQLTGWDLKAARRSGIIHWFRAADDAPTAGQPPLVGMEGEGPSVAAVAGGGLHTWGVAPATRTARGAVRNVRAVWHAPDGTVWLLAPDALSRWHQDGRPELTSAVKLTCFHVGGEDVLLGRADGWLVRHRPGADPEQVAKAADAAVTAVARFGGVTAVGTEAGAVVLGPGPGAVTLADAHRGPVRAVAVGPKGWVASGSDDGAVRVWGPDGRPVLTLPQSGKVRKVFWPSHQPWLLVWVDGERAVRRWRLDMLKKELSDLGIDPDLP